MKKLILLNIYFLLPVSVHAHCPLCTVGAGALAVAAASLGVSTASVGVFIGAFALALGLWFAKVIKKKYFSYQDPIVALLAFLSTIVPIMPFIREYRSFYISLVGEYGTIFHNTYMINLFILGSAVGAVLLFTAPYLSRILTKVRENKTLPYQGIGITFILLIIAASILQLST